MAKPTAELLAIDAENPPGRKYERCIQFMVKFSLDRCFLCKVGPQAKDLTGGNPLTVRYRVAEILENPEAALRSIAVCGRIGGTDRGPVASKMLSSSESRALTAEVNSR